MPYADDSQGDLFHAEALRQALPTGSGGWGRCVLGSATAYLLASEHDDAGAASAAVVFLSSAAALVTVPAAVVLVV